MSYKTDETIQKERKHIEAKGYSHASLVFGLYGILPFLGFMSIVAIILAIIAGKKGCYYRRRTAGIVLGITGLIETFAIIVYVMINLDTYYFMG